MAESLQDLTESLNLFDNWEDRYRYLIDLGQRLPPMDEDLKIEENLVRGCTSRVWLVANTVNGKFSFIADSDALIVKGLIYVLLVAFQDKPVSEVSAIKIEKTFHELGLDKHLSPNRRNGFFAMVDRIRVWADLAQA